MYGIAKWRCVSSYLFGEENEGLCLLITGSKSLTEQREGQGLLSSALTTVFEEKATIRVLAKTC